MKVCLINHSDIRGGASIAALRLLNALQKSGVDARMLVKQVDGDSRHDISVIGGGLRDKLCFLAERGQIFMANGFNRAELFKVSTGSFGLPVHNHPWVREADIVVINWINQGMMSVDELRRIDKPIVWIMHDMWPLTGICHYSFGCERYDDECGCCKFLGAKSRPHDLSYRTLKKKAAIYPQCNINFVAVSRWLGDMALKSTLLGKEPVTVINNTFPVDDYLLTPVKSRGELGLPDESKRLIVLCSARIDAPVKDFPAAIEAVNRVAENGVDDIALVLCGQLRNRSLLEKLRVPFFEMGNVTDDTLKDIYSHSSVLLSSAKYETFGLTLIEGLASGAVPVAVGGDGREDIIDHKQNGYLSRPGDVDDLARGIIWALGANISRESLHQSAADKFSEKVIAGEYIRLFEQILKK